MSQLINRKARYAYEIIDTYEFGIALKGWEVKSLRAKKLNFTVSYIKILNNELLWLGADILPLQTATTGVERKRTIKLLAHRHEIFHLMAKIKEKGLTVIPLALDIKKGRFKLKAGLGRGKSDRDKRQTIKEREWNIEKQRSKF